MRVIIGGAGRVGSELARAMRAETMDVVLIDSDSRAVKNAQSLDALVIHGDITSREALQEAGIGDATVFVAVTDSDDRNLIACALAARARVYAASTRAASVDAGSAKTTADESESATAGSNPGR